jgi:hypothetical protein
MAKRRKKAAGEQSKNTHTYQTIEKKGGFV